MRLVTFEGSFVACVRSALSIGIVVAGILSSLVQAPTLRLPRSRGFPARRPPDPVGQLLLCAMAPTRPRARRTFGSTFRKMRWPRGRTARRLCRQARREPALQKDHRSESRPADAAALDAQDADRRAERNASGAGSSRAPNGTSTGRSSRRCGRPCRP